MRQALDMAINRQAIIDAVYQGQGQAASNPFPSSLWSYNKSLKNAPYNVAAAKALLAKAGYPNGFELSLWAMRGAAAVQPQRQADGGDDTVRLGQDRRQGQDRDL